MTATSRPLRALGVVLGSWTVARVVALWPVAGIAADVPLVDATRAEAPRSAIVIPLDDDVSLFAKHPLSQRAMALLRQAQEVVRVEQSALKMADPMPNDDTPMLVAALASPRADVGLAIAPGLPVVRGAARLSGSVWALMRGDGAPSLANGGQLGGSQVGMRLFYKPGPQVLAITARISTPVSQPGGREAAVGVALRGRNVGIIVEQRFALDHIGDDAPAIFAYGGVSDVKVGRGITLDGYVQGGVVGVKAPAAFADGAVRVERALLKTQDASLSVGAGVWGGAQPGVARLDVGPQVVARLRVADATLRVSAEWRQRVAGDAAPASGPSVTVGFDF